jgi:glycosyltransferase involved in cell wall biosynthesis
LVLDPTYSANLPLAILVSPVSDIGGVARHFIDIQSCGIPGFKLHFALPDGPLADELTKRGAEVSRLRFGSQYGALASWWSLTRLVFDKKPAILHSHLAFADFIAAMVSLPKIRRVTTEHGIAGGSIYHANSMTSQLRRLLHSLRLKKFDLAIAVSHSTAEQMKLQWKPRIPLKVIFNGVDSVPSSKPLRAVPLSKSIRLLTLSRLSHEKQIDLALRAMQVLKQRGVDARLTVTGDGPDKLHLQKLATELDIRDRVDFPGVVDSVKALADADIVIQLSKWENCSYTLLDARVRGLGIIATAVGGNPELVDESSLVKNPTAETIAQLVLSGNLNRTPKEWPSVRDMCGQLSQAYRELL